MSTAAVLVLAGIPPGDLLSLERKFIYRRRSADSSLQPSLLSREARLDTMEKWQARWSLQTTVATWTRRLLPSVDRWMNRPVGAPMTYHLAQALTGHGAFNGYLHRFGIIGFTAWTARRRYFLDMVESIFGTKEQAERDRQRRSSLTDG